MTVINIDCLQFKRSKKAIRLIESKHITEHMPYSQLEVLRILSNVFNSIDTNYKIEVCIVRGDDPYNEIKVADLTNKRDFLLIGDEVKRWCEFTL